MKLIDKIKEIKEQNPNLSESEIIKKIVDQLNIPKILAITLYDLIKEL